MIKGHKHHWRDDVVPMHPAYGGPVAIRVCSCGASITADKRTTRRTVALATSAVVGVGILTGCVPPRQPAPTVPPVVVVREHQIAERTVPNITPPTQLDVIMEQPWSGQVATYDPTTGLTTIQEEWVVRCDDMGGTPRWNGWAPDPADFRVCGNVDY